MYSQTTISGFVKDSKSGEVLIGAYIFIVGTSSGTVSNNAGYYSLSISNSAKIKTSYIGYQPIVTDIKNTNDTLLNILLTPGVEIDEVSVQASRSSNFNISKLSAKEIKQVPSLGGVPDVFRAMQLLPGIQGQSEASSLLVVRGGSPGQNLYLLDNTPLIYVNHVGGFLSVFNPDIINDISIIKGGFPSQYGGKLSSIVNITQRNGDTSQHKGSFGIGVSDINLTLEGPLGKKASYIFTGRKTLYDLLFLAASSFSGGNSSTVVYGFHDINAKLTWNPNSKNKFFVNLYQGDDYFNAYSKPDSELSTEKSKLSNTWGNWLVAANWNYVASAKLFGETGISYTRYRLKDKQTLKEAGDYDYENTFKSSVQDIALRTNWSYNLSSFWKIKYGAQHSLMHHEPYNLNQSGYYNYSESRAANSNLTSAFIESKITFSKYLEFNLGVRGATYSINSYRKNMIEPRVSATIKFSDNIKTNLSYMQVNQTSHLLMASGNNIMATEIWLPANEAIQPSWSEQYAVSNNINFANNMFSSELSVYYKNMQNLTTYKEGVVNIKNDINWESLIETGGIGKSYGIELMLKKNYGNWTGSIAYTWSQTTRQFNNINNGNIYWYEYHRPHSFSIFINRKINEKWDFNALWVYQSGVPYTPVIGRQYNVIPDMYDNSNNPVYEEVLIYGERNSDKLKNYHRLDIGLNCKKTTKRGRNAIWTFSIYNVYSRQNPNMYYYNVDDTEDISANRTNETYKPLNLYQLSLFPFIPAVSYKVFFEKSDKKKKSKQKFKNWLNYENK